MSPRRRASKGPEAEIIQAPRKIMRSELDILRKDYDIQLTQPEMQQVFERAGVRPFFSNLSKEQLRKKARDGFAQQLRMRAAKGDRQALSAYRKYSRDKRADAQIKGSKWAAQKQLTKLESKMGGWELTKAEKDKIIKGALDPKSYSQTDRTRNPQASEMVQRKVRQLFQEVAQERIMKGDKAVMRDRAVYALDRLQPKGTENPLTKKEEERLMAAATSRSSYKGKPTIESVREFVEREYYKMRPKAMREHAAKHLDDVDEQLREKNKTYETPLTAEERKKILAAVEKGISKYRGRLTKTNINDMVTAAFYRSSAFKERVLERTADNQLADISKDRNLSSTWGIRLTKEEKKRIVTRASKYRFKKGASLDAQMRIAVYRELEAVLKGRNSSRALAAASTMAGWRQQEQRKKAA